MFGHVMLARGLEIGARRNVSDHGVRTSAATHVRHLHMLQIPRASNFNCVVGAPLGAAPGRGRMLVQKARLSRL